jgi:hypothetical protein
MGIKKELSLQDWKELGNNAKVINKCYLEMLEILNVLPNTHYWALFNSAFSKTSKLISHLDNMYECRYGNSPDYMPRLFLGEPE